MPISFNNLSLIYTVYLPLALAVFVGLVAFFSFRHVFARKNLAVILALVLPIVASLFTFLLGTKAPVSLGVSAIVSSWHGIWVFVSLPASVILGIIFAVLAYDALEPRN